MLIAGDTFRAGAVEQLSVWADKTDSIFYGKEKVQNKKITTPKQYKMVKIERRRKRINYLALISVLVSYAALSIFNQLDSIFLMIVSCLIFNVDKETISNEI